MKNVRFVVYSKKNGVILAEFDSELECIVYIRTLSDSLNSDFSDSLDYYIF